jgi:hypothetical protein
MTPILTVALLASAHAWQADGVKTLTGCVDERPGDVYVLRGDRDLRLLAVMEPVGFKPEGLARYLGHKVTAYGEVVEEGGRTTIRVRKIVSLSASCIPADAGTSTDTAAVPVSKDTTATGCLDEQPGPVYVLRGDPQLKVILELEAVGFTAENFARYLGQKVELHGDIYRRGKRDFMKVRKIVRIAGRCVAPPA